MRRAASSLVRALCDEAPRCGQTGLRSFSTPAQPITAVAFPGDGIGPEIMEAVQTIFQAADVPIVWNEQLVQFKEVDPRTNSYITRENLDAVLETRIGLKAPLTTPVGKGFRSLNLTLRKELNLYANVRPCFSLPGFKTKYDGVNLVTVRENTEGEYSGLEHQVVPGVVESLKVITKQASTRVCEFAFQYAQTHGRKSVAAVHKANIQKMSDGLFLECARRVQKGYPDLEYQELIVDNACMQLVKDPTQFDVLVMPNLYGDIISDLCAGLVGGLGVTPSGNIGYDGLALMEAVHGTAPDIAGKDMANPTALLLSGVMMLRHLELFEHASRIEKACFDTIANGPRTRDLGGTASKSEFMRAIIERVRDL